MEIPVKHSEDNINYGKYECGFCHRKWETPEQRMICERECLEKKREIERQNELEDRRNKDKIKQEKANADFEIIKKELRQIQNHAEAHRKNYGETIYFCGEDIKDFNPIIAHDDYGHFTNPWWDEFVKNLKTF